MKKFLFLFLFSSFTFSIEAQPYLNQREHFGYVNSKITSILVDQDGYYLTGIILDTVITGGYQWQSLIIKTNFEGDTIFNKTTTQFGEDLELWGDRTFFTQDSTIIAYGDWYTPRRYGLIMEYSKKGEVLRKKQISNPINPEGHSITLDEIVPLPSGNYIFTSTPIDSFGSAHTAIGKMDSDFNILWFKSFGDSISHSAYSLVMDKDHDCIIGGIIADSGRGFGKSLNFQINLIKVDTSGNMIWDFKSEVKDSLAYPYDMAFDDKGDLMIATSAYWFKEFTILDDTFGTSYLKPAVIKFDTTEKKIVWKKIINSANWERHRTLKRILPTLDNSGFIVAGRIRMNHQDSTNIDNRGLIFKITTGGDTQWIRNYQYLTDGEREQYLNDMEATPDGGFVAGGVSIRSVFTPADHPPLRTWLIKTDEFGCLVPGCESPRISKSIKKRSFLLSTLTQQNQTLTFI